MFYSAPADLEARFVTQCHKLDWIDSNPWGHVNPWKQLWLDDAETNFLTEKDAPENLARFVFRQLRDADPSEDKIYLQTLCRWFFNEQIGWPEQCERIKIWLAHYHSFHGFHRSRTTEKYRALPLPDSEPRIRWSTADKFIIDISRMITRDHFRADAEGRQQRDTKFADGLQAQILYHGLSDGIRVYEIKTEDAADAFSAGPLSGGNPVRNRYYQPDASAYKVPYIQVEYPDGTRLRTHWGKGKGQNTKYGSFLVDEADQEMNLRGFLVHHPELIPSFAGFVQSRLRIKDPFFDESDPNELDWNTISLAGHIKEYRHLITPDILDEGIASLRSISYIHRGVAIKEIKALSLLPEWRARVPKELVHDLFVRAASHKQIGVAQNLLSVILTVPEWRRTIVASDLNPLIAGLTDRRCEGGTFQSLAYLLCNLAQNHSLHGAGEAAYLDPVLIRLTKRQEWRMLKKILAGAVQDENWGKSISRETRNAIAATQDNAIKFNKIDFLLDRLASPLVDGRRQFVDPRLRATNG
jgi:hypothetical protein